MKKSIYIILVLLIISCKQKKENIYDIYNKCYSETAVDTEKSISHYIKSFEKELIKNNYLKDSTSESYYRLFNKLKEYEYIDLKTNYNFKDSIMFIKYNGTLECASEIKDHSDFEKSIFGKLGKFMLQNNGNHNGFFQSQHIDSIFNEKTFKFDYIKQKMFASIKLYNGQEYINGKILFNKDNYPKYVSLKWNDREEIFWNNNKIKGHLLENKAYEYFLKNGKEGLIFLENNLSSNALGLMKVHSSLVFAEQRLKDSISLIRHKKEFRNLNKLQQEFISRKYSFNINERYPIQIQYR